MEEKAAHWEKVNRLNFPESSNSFCSSDSSEAPLTRLSKHVWELFVPVLFGLSCGSFVVWSQTKPNNTNLSQGTTRVTNSPLLHDVSLSSPFLKWHLLNIIYIFHNISGESCVLIYADKFQSSKVKLRYVAPEKLRMWSDFIFILTSETRWSAEWDESLHQWLFLFSFCKTKDRTWTLRKCKRWTNELKIITDVWSKNTAGWLSLVHVDLYSTSCSSRFCCQCVLTFPAVRTRCWRSADASVWSESGQQTSRHDWSAAAASRWPDAELSHPSSQCWWTKSWSLFSVTRFVFQMIIFLSTVWSL